MTDIRALQISIAHHRDQAAYKQLFLLLYKPVLYFANTIVRNDDVAEELYSDVMLKIWFMDRQLEPIANLKQYIYTAVRNAALNHLKKESKASFTDLEAAATIVSDIDSPEEHLLKNEFQQKKEAAISSLPTQCQLVYRLIKENGFNYRQTAEILDISPNTVERHMNTALKKLVAYLRPYVFS